MAQSIPFKQSHQGFIVAPIQAFNDNYIWAICDSSGNAWVVDPGEAQPVLALFQQKHINLCGILLTHHHGDHTGGVTKLLAHFGQDIPVYGPQGCHPSITHPLDSKGALALQSKQHCFDLNAKVWPTPGHTLDHWVYLIDDALFCGDTLFSCGCGRMFEGTPEQLYTSLASLDELSPLTRVYAAHEYTLANIKFALIVEPDNHELQQYAQTVAAERQRAKPTLPSTIGLEQAINPFLHCTDDRLQKVLQQQFQQPCPEPEHRLKLLRLWKDNF
ncbi:hydroxyacylglutathione hydrolase [Shewanella avicenniae]|uniref:Hydroxyacylglutathione hydrolase n=1 Tax=Shewanella avicenniae TaxID=2814294 RepID=A0ABX7QVE3_9GAMM|nr:hydroxyacylglutathione hydrolase [Shewanella avicenniae]QSX35239.1 hydroxyacylglutathione hydrolase [Shewanella avicenniae]